MTGSQPSDPLLSAGDSELRANESGLGSNDDQSPADPVRVLVSCVLAWAVPGLGHLSVGRVGRGLFFGGVILALFLAGIALDGKVYKPEAGMTLTYLAAVGAAGVGFPYVVAHATGYGLGDLYSGTYEYGTTFTLVAGLLNLLVVFDAYDVSTGRR